MNNNTNRAAAYNRITAPLVARRIRRAVIATAALAVYMIATSVIIDAIDSHISK